MLFRFCLLFFLLALGQHTKATPTNFTQCLLLVRNNTYGPHAGLDNHGQPLDNIADATSIPYDVCKAKCGTALTPFRWMMFAQEFSVWLLPYLALLSQLPFGAHDLWDNHVAVLLTVGSPAIAAYSIVITVLNGRWISRLFNPYTYPNSRNAVRILSSLQQSPLRIDQGGCLLASLVVLPENDEWWKELVIWLEYYPHSWSISAASSIAWVVVAYVFTVIDSFTPKDGSEQAVETVEGGVIQPESRGVGSIWLWLIPIVICWLQISPKCDNTRVRQALNRANDIAYVATYTRGSDEVVLASRMSNRRAIYLDNHRLDTLNADEHVSVPVYNYARLFAWTKAVQTVASAFSEATSHADSFEPVDPEMDWIEGNQHQQIRPENRSGTSTQIRRYCIPPQPTDPYKPGVWNRIFIGFLAALALQWGTAGAAFLTLYFTLTTGLGCRSGAYLLYAAASTIAMTMLVMSSILAHYASSPRPYPSPEDLLPIHDRHSPQSLRCRILAWSSILLRRLGKLLAVSNAIWLVLTCIFQFTGFFDRCYCNSSVIGRGAKAAYDVLVFLQEDVSSMRIAWIGGELMAVGTATLFILFVKLMIVIPSFH